MTGIAIATMILVCGVVWGGFGWLLMRAVRSEGAKERAAGPSEGSHGGG